VLTNIATFVLFLQDFRVLPLHRRLFKLLAAQPHRKPSTTDTQLPSCLSVILMLSLRAS
jgi:hypothetical protein